MKQSVILRESKKSLYIACAVAAAFTFMLAGILFNEELRSDAGYVTWLFLAFAMVGYYGILDYLRSYIQFDEEGIKVSSTMGKVKSYSYDEISSMTYSGSFLFVYGDGGRMVASLDGDITACPEALDLLKKHQVPLLMRAKKQRFKNNPDQ